MRFLVRVSTSTATVSLKLEGRGNFPQGKEKRAPFGARFDRASDSGQTSPIALVR